MFWILVCVALLIFLYFGLIKPFTYWSKKGVHQKPILSQWYDNMCLTFQLRPSPEILRLHCHQFLDKRYCGAYQFFNPVLYLLDPDIIKQITVQDFDHFVDHNQYASEDINPLWAKNLVCLKGERWRQMRATLSPSFTSSKMRAMFGLIEDCSKQFIHHFQDGKEIHQVEMKTIFSRFANDVIGSVAFGITCDSLKNPNNEFYLMGVKAATFRGIWQTFKLFMTMFFPKLAKITKVKIFSTEVNEFFRNLIKTNITLREKNGIVRPDMIHLLMEARKGRLQYETKKVDVDTSFAVIEESAVGKNEKHLKLTDDDIAAQAVIFFVAGFDTVSTLLSFIAYELAINPEIQETLRKEITKTMNTCHNCLTYESLLKMKYMDMVVSETLRKWPPAILTDRACTKPYTIKPQREGEEPVLINQGEVVWIPVYAIHRNQNYYPDPDRFDPERFNDINKININPYSYLPFGVGPRSCIGNRLALLEVKTLLFHILYNFDITVTKKTTVPLELDVKEFSLLSKGGFWLGLKPRTL